MPGKKYSDKEKEQYLSLASEVGHSRARRELGYPKHWGTANSWAKEYNVTIAVDELKQKSAEFNDWYKTEDLLIIMQEVLERGREFINDYKNLTPDEYKKTTEGIKRATETMQLLQGKATTRGGTEREQAGDDPFKEALDAFLTAEQKQDDQNHRGASETA